jgi:hypothetical protein
MTETLLFVGVGSLLIVAAGTLTVAALTLRKARRYVELAEERLEYLREGQAQLLVFLLEERQSLKEELEQEREQHLEAQRRAERQPLLQVQRRLTEGLGDPSPGARHEEAGRELRTRRGVERRIGQLERELEVLRRVQGRREAGQEVPSLLSERSFAGVPETRGLAEEKRPQEEDNRPRLAVWHPHPDDDVSPRRASAATARAPGDAPIEMFRRHYDKYLENYEGYVKLAQRIYRMRDEAPPGSLAKREWEERLRRVNDGIERTTARLDILEQYNPELVTDDRISHRAEIARRHGQLVS